MGLSRSNSFHVLTCPSLCGLQKVSGSRSVGFFSCLDLSLNVRSPGSEWVLVGQILSVSSFVPPFAILQSVSGPRLVGFFLYPDFVPSSAFFRE